MINRWPSHIFSPGLNELRGDLERFVFLLGGGDGEDLFGSTVED